jgi:hypothetical protein
MQANEKRRFRTREAAAYVRLAPSTMAKMRMRGDGPQYSKAGPRVVIYHEDKLDAWLAARSRRSTGERTDALLARDREISLDHATPGAATPARNLAESGGSKPKPSA